LECADLFFWFWHEFVLSGIMLFALLLFWGRVDKSLPSGVRSMMLVFFLFSFLLILFYATLFTAGAYRGEWKTWDTLPDFLAGKKLNMILTGGSFTFLLALTLCKRDFGFADSNDLAMLFHRKCFVVLGIYVLFMVYGWIREWTTGARSIEVSPGYLKMMGLALVVLKFAGE
jgi:hypothetical protein